MNSKAIEVCYSSNGINFEKRDIVGHYWGGSSGILLKDNTITLAGLDFSDRDGIKDTQTGYSIKGVGFLQSRDGWNFSKFKPEISNLDRDIIACGDPTLIKLPEDGYRMYFTDGKNGCHGDAPLLSAYSQNGQSYSFEGKVTGAQGVNLEIVDFTVLYEKNSKRYYIYTRTENFDKADVLESVDGRHFTRRFRIQIPFSFQFSIINEGDYYSAYGGHIPADNKPDSNLRYPVKAISTDGINWERTQDQPMGPWLGNTTYCNTYAVVKLSNGYYFY
ncbi:MAG: hypothetical protein WBD86_01975 [Microgenomates group bacterium]